MTDRHADDLFLRLAEGRDLTDVDRRHLESCAECREAAARAGRFSSEVERWARAAAVEPMPPDLILAEPGPRRFLRLATLGVAGLAAVALVLVVPSLGPRSPFGPGTSSSPDSSRLALQSILPSPGAGFPTVWPDATGCAPADTVADAPGDAPDPLPEGAEVTWGVEAIPGSPAGWLQNPLAGAFWGDRLVVVGSESPRVGAETGSLVLVRDADGTWTQGGIAEPNLELSRVAVSADEVLVLGTDYGGDLPTDTQVVIFRSRDGVNWQRVFAAPGYGSSIHRTPVGWLALAMDPTGNGHWALTSADGTSWAATELYAGELYAGIAEVGWGSDGWFAAGAVDEGDRTHAALWRSTDGVTWSCEILAVAERDRLAQASFALDGPSGLIAFGQDNVRCRDLASCIAGPSLLWHALNDGRWYAVQGDAALPPIGNWAMAGDGTSGLWSFGGQGAWHWDGREWSEVPASAQSDALEAISLLPAGAAVDLGRLLVVGQTMRPDGNPGEGVVVIGDVAP